MAEIKTVRLNRSDSQPWGFRLQGGRDYGVDLSVLKVICGSIAERAGLMAGDLICKINNIDVFHMTHKEAQDLIVRSGNNIDIQIQRGPTTLWRPTVTPTGPLPTSVGNNSGLVTRTSLAHKPQVVSHIGCGYNNAARPFVNGRDGQLKSIMNAQHNTPIGLYSDESIAETLSAQAEVLAGGVLGVNFKKNEKVYNAANSEVYKFLQEQEHDPHEPEPQAPQNFFWTASHAIGGRRSPLPLYNAATVDVSKTQHQQQYHHEKSSITSSSAATTEIENSTSVIKHDERIGTSLQQNTLAPEAPHRPSLPTSAATSTSTNQSYKDYQELEKYKDSSSSVMFGSGAGAGGSVPTCDGCGVSIVGVFVRIKDKNLHVDCFKCATCGTSLKNQGYFNLNNKLYCDIHAKLAAMQNPPAGTEGYLPVPIKPGTKLSASTISAALSAHHLHQANGGTTHLITSPTSNTTNYSSPKPFGPPVSSQKSPTSYPPQHQQQQQQQQQYQQTNWSQQSSKPATNPYATLPRSTGPTQGRFNTYKPGIINNFNRGSNKGGAFGATSAPKRGRGILNKAVGPGVRIPHCGCCNTQIRGPFITALGRIWCPDHFVCVNANCRRALQDIGFVEEKGDLYCEYCFEKYLAPTCSKCNAKIKGDCLNAIGKHFHPECFTCAYCGKIFGNTPFFMEEGEPYCEADWNELFTTKCFACGFPVEAGDRWVEALNHNYHSQCFNCTLCKKNLEGQSFYNKGGRPFCKNHAR